MAVFCGVCGNPISNAAENDGSFQVNDNFQGWNVEGGKARIQDTCERCGEALRKVITATANKIASRNKKRVDERRQRVQERMATDARIKTEKDEFEREWQARRSKGV